LYRQPQEWCARAITNVAGMGVFSSDRTIREYARQIWHIEPDAIPNEPDANKSTARPDLAVLKRHGSAAHARRFLHP
jgi:hypothetical protein